MKTFFNTSQSEKNPLLGDCGSALNEILKEDLWVLKKKREKKDTTSFKKKTKSTGNNM